jgi:hypothetical protein
MNTPPIAHYWIAQHLDDLFRNEPKNIGVFVKSGASRCARFLGEDSSKQIDGRRLRALSHPEVYRQWLDFWRQGFDEPAIDPLQLSGRHYRVIDGGDVTDIATDSCVDVANYLYSLLVSEGGLQEALGSEDDEAERASAPLASEVLVAFRSLDILGDQAGLLVPHPVQRNATVHGKKSAYTPAFVQENGRLFVMEVVDFRSRYRQRSRDHAGWSAYLFRDVRESREDAEPIAIISVSGEDRDDPDVEAGITVLENESRIVHWNEDSERQRFLQERRDVAYRK